MNKFDLQSAEHSAAQVQYKIIFIPLSSKEDTSIAAVENQESNWLENNGSDLLDEINLATLDERQTENMSSIDTETMENNTNLTAMFEGQVLAVTSLEIEIQQQKIYLQTEKGLVELKEGDIVKLHQLTLKVKIEKTTLVGFPEANLTESRPVRHEDPEDIWGLDTQLTSLQKLPEIQDPFSYQPQEFNQVLPNVKTPSHDPLNFLYSQHSQHTHPNSAVDFPAPQEKPSALFEPPTASQHSSAVHSLATAQGNILKDLGISEDQSSYLPPSSTKGTLTEQAPLDVLDELLGEEDTLQMPVQQAPSYRAPNISMQASEPHPYFRPSSAFSTPSKGSSMMNSFKNLIKKIGK